MPAVIVFVVILLLPLPAIALDILVVLNLVLAILIFLVVLYSRKITDYLLLPTVLLVSSVFGFTVNIAAARLILAEGAAFDDWVIKTVASWAAGSGEIGSVIAGFALFIVIIGFLLLVLVKASRRVSEVAARFNLDSLPMKQMAIDTEYCAGVITKEETLANKEDLQRESDFYGALDGAHKFISGNVKVCCYIIVITIIGGSAIDVLIRGVTIISAVKTYIPLAIGSGALFLFPVLLLSIAAGIVVTRTVNQEAEEVRQGVGEGE